LRDHLLHTKELLDAGNASTIDAMKKIPNNDFKSNPAWFVKWGYYTTITVYRIAVVSAWLWVYQNALLFYSYREGQAFLSELYRKSQRLKASFSHRTCLLYYYFAAVGEKLIESNASESSAMSFATFCSRSANDRDFRLLFEQVHMYIWFLGNRDQKYLDTIPSVIESLNDLVGFLEKRQLLSGFEVERPKPAIEELGRAKTEGWTEQP
jgi:hypothetical protein